MALNNVPRSGQSLNATRNSINENFSGIDTGFAVDHVAFTAGGTTGKHNQITFTDLGAAQGATVGNELLLYNNAAALFLQNSSNDNFNVTGATNAQADGHMFTWSGHVIRWGEVTATGATTVAFPTAFGTTPTTVMLTVSAASTPNRVFWNPATSTAANLGVTVTAADGTTSATATFYFWAFGAR